jgi:hypothetical protein
MDSGRSRVGYALDLRDRGLHGKAAHQRRIEGRMTSEPLYWVFYGLVRVLPLRLKERLVRWLSQKHPDVYQEAVRRAVHGK